MICLQDPPKKKLALASNFSCLLSFLHKKEMNNVYVEQYWFIIESELSYFLGCPYSCVRRAPYAFSFTAENGTARATSQGLT